jgi:hypothetical protein
MRKIVLYSFVAILLASCVDLEEEPIGKVAPEGYFKTEKDIEGFVLGMYATITASRSPFAVFLMVDILSDDMDISQVNFRPYRFFLNQYEFNPSNTIAGNSDGDYWVACYSAINCANIIIENAPLMISIPEEKRLAFEAEARYIRAFNYFHLVRVNGDVPYNARPMADPKEGKTKPRDSAEEIYRAIVEDLKFAIEHLPDQAATMNSQGFSVRSRATRGAALGLLAKVHLTLTTYNKIYADAYEYRSINTGLIDSLATGFPSHWEAAAYYAKEVIQNKDAFGYELEPDFQNLFNGEKGDCKEFLFSVDFAGNVQGPRVAGQEYDGWHNNNNGGALWIPQETGGWGTAATTMDLFNLYHWGDYRRDVTFDITCYLYDDAPHYNEMTGKAEGTILDSYHYTRIDALPNPYIAKWCRYPGIVESWPDNTRNSMNYPQMRYAEVLLIAAEAQNQLGQTAEAIGYVNQLRARARQRSMNPGDDSSYPVDLSNGLSQEEAAKAIWNEWRLELAFEWKRWFNLVRCDSLLPVISRHVPFVTGVPVNPQPYHILLPIPQIEMDNTSALIQNKGY